MSQKMNNVLIKIVITAFLLHHILFAEIRVSKYSNTKDNLSKRWEWAQNKSRNYTNGFWIGYCFERSMARDAFIGHSQDWQRNSRFTLEMIIQDTVARHTFYNESNDISESAQRALHRWNHKGLENENIPKKVAILFYFRSSDANFALIHDVQVTNLSLHIDLRQKSLLWLGEVDQQESIAFLTRIFEMTEKDEVKEDLIGIVGLHKGIAETFIFLNEIIRSENDDDLRGNAIFWMGQQDTEDALHLLKHTLRHDKSRKIRKKSVFALSQLALAEVSDVLIDIAKYEKDIEIKKEAIFWLTQTASKKVASTLEEVINNDEEIEIKKHAVFALTQLDNNENVPVLIRIANEHPSVEVRKSAIFWLGESEDPRALQAIIKIVRDN
jgi:HEAT repeat protein